MNGSIRKRGEKSCELTIDLGRDASGKRLRKFVNVKGTKAEAQRRLREILALLDKGLPVDGKKITLAECRNLGEFNKLERKTGFEPATLSLARRCSTAEPLPPLAAFSYQPSAIMTPRPGSDVLKADLS